MLKTIVDKYFPRSEFIRNVVTLVTGTTIAQALPLLAMPVFTNLGLYTAEDFGLLGLYMSLIMPLATIATGRYETAIILPKEDDDSKNIAVLTFFTGLCFSVLLLLFVHFFNRDICAWLSSPRIGPWLYLVPAGIVFVTVNSIAVYWLLRKRGFKEVSANKIVQGGTSAVSGISFGFAGWGNGLILSDVFTRGVVAVVSWVQVRKQAFDLSPVSWAGIRKNAARYKDFPFYNALPALLSTFVVSVPVIYTSRFYDESVVGYINLSRMVIFVPLALISAAISQVLLERISRKKSLDQQLLPEVIIIVKRLALIGILTILVVEAGGAFFFQLIFGDGWEVAGQYSRILVFTFVIQFVVTPLNVVFAVLERVKLGSLLQVIYFATVCSVFFIRNITVETFLLLFVGIEVLNFLAGFALVYLVVKKHDDKLQVKIPA